MVSNYSFEEAFDVLSLDVEGTPDLVVLEEAGDEGFLDGCCMFDCHFDS